MIASLNGILTEKFPESIVLDVGGVGYEVFIPLSTYYQLPELKQTVCLHIHTHVREDTLQLYGFFSPLEKRLFLLLTSVSGVGPKLGRNILSGIEIEPLLSALRKGSMEQLRSIPGVGPKLAGRLALELKDKVAALIDTTKMPVDTTPVYDDTLSALVNLGYQEREARRAIDAILREAPQPVCGVEYLIKRSLRILSRVT
jgi:Holliday junction DNA helicase RuvA